jgi:arginine-tRNA-protein transferase
VSHTGGAEREQARRRLGELIGRLALRPDQPAPCPYLPGRKARFVYLRPRSLAPGVYHLLMDLNFRRLGAIVYRPQCDACRECRQIRIDVAWFRPNRAQSRCLRRNADVTASWGEPQATRAKHDVYERYLAARHEGQMSGAWEEFAQGLYDDSPLAREVVFRTQGRLLGAGIVDIEPEAMSAVYFYFDPDLAGRSPGTLNVLELVQECRRRAIPWLYLGYHVAGSASMSYKAAFRPHQLLGDDGRWTSHDPTGSSR